MEVLLSAHNLSKAFAARPLFKNLNFGVHKGARICLVGPNGAGKSTLLRILSGLETPDSGRVVKINGLRVGFLEQDPVFPPNQTLFECALQKADHPDDWEAQSNAYEWISRCGFIDEGYDESTQISSLSGGWKKRAGLMREMMRLPDLLLLDEPTNHLDLESVLWLEDLLENSKCAYLVITHDRKFMQRIAETIFDLDRRYPDGIFKVDGTLSDYLQIRAAELESQARLEQKMKNTLRIEYAWLLKEPRARTVKSKSRINRTEEMMADVDDIVDRNRRRSAELKFVASTGGTQKLIEAKGMGRTFGDREVLKNIDLLVTVKSRIGLLGRNGSGKSTLIKTLLGFEKPDSGTVTRADHLEVIYFSQEREKLKPEMTPRSVLCPQGEFVQFAGNFIHVNGYLERFLLSGDLASTQICKLSGGEQSRLHIAKLMLNPGNLLVLDEPTNDLDLDTLHVLEEALESFTGGLILVTHDRLFLNRLCQEILYVNDGGLERFADVLQWEEYYLQRNSKSALAAASVAAATKAATAQASGGSASKKKLSLKDQNELDSMEVNIRKAEAGLVELMQQLESSGAGNSANNMRDLSSKLASAQSVIDKLYARWEELLKLKG